MMVQLTSGWLVALVGLVLTPALARGRAWPWARDLASTALLYWLDPTALLFALVATLLCVRAPPEKDGRFGLAALAALFLAARVGERRWGWGLPVGFGFTVLRLGHYWVERARGTLPAHDLRALYAWLVYAPTVVMGPIQRFDTWLRWEGRHRFDPEAARLGLWRVLSGYLRIVLLAYALVSERLLTLLADWPAPVAVTLRFVLFLYLTLAGMSDIAIGLGRVWGQPIAENFDAPFARTDLAGFWRSWHMSVSNWVRDYVYLPLLATTRRPMLSAAAGVAIFAMWHELSVAMFAWGAWQGLGLAIGRRLPTPQGPAKLLGWAATMAWLGAGWWMMIAWPRGDAWYAR